MGKPISAHKLRYTHAYKLNHRDETDGNPLLISDRLRLSRLSTVIIYTNDREKFNRFYAFIKGSRDVYLKFFSNFQ